MWNLERLQVPNRSTLFCAAGAMALCLLLSWLRVRPIGLFFFIFFCYWIYKTRCVFQIVAPPELHSKYTQLLQRVCDWRQQRPLVFCAVSCGCLAALAIIGHIISGSAVALFILVVAAIMSTKYNFKLIKLEPQAYAWSEKLNNYDAELDEEFMPDVNETNLFVLERASNSATISSPLENVAGIAADAEADDDNSDDIPSELLLADALPEIDESSSDEHENELLPLAKMPPTTTTTTIANVRPPLIADAQETLAAVTPQMDFKRGHFKRDSSLSTTSSSSEESLSKGLKFPDHTMVDGIGAGAGDAARNNMLDLQTQAQNLIMSKSKILPSLVTGLVQWSLGSGTATVIDGQTAATSGSAAAVPALANVSTANQKRPTVSNAPDLSGESDFEMLDDEDFE